MHLILDLDYWTTKFINGVIPHNSFFDTVFNFLSLTGAWKIIWIIIIVLIINSFKKNRTELTLLIASFVTLSLIVIELGLKNIFARLRPIDLANISTYCPGSFSFPSGHAAAAFGSAVIFSHYDKKRQSLYFAIATLISLSRLYLGCHYLTDVIAGAIVGYIFAKILMSFIRRSFSSS